MQLNKENFTEFWKNPFLFNLKLFFRPRREAYGVNTEIPLRNGQNFLEAFADDLENGIKWCNDSSEHWAETLTVKVNELIITFNLAILAFDATATSLFENHQGILRASIIFSIISLVILTQCLISISRRNINSFGDKKLIMSKTHKKLFLSPNEAIDAIREYNTEMIKAQNDIRKITEFWLPIQSIGVYLFMASVTSIAVGILLVKI